MPNIIRALALSFLLSTLAACGAKDKKAAPAIEAAPAQIVYAPALRHDIHMTITPGTNSFRAADALTIPAALAKSEMEFKLASHLNITLGGEAETLSLKQENQPAQDIGMDRDNDESQTPLSVNTYILSGLTPGQDNTLSLHISGEMNFPITEIGDEYGRGVSVTPGLIEERGVYLSGASYWVPTMDDTLVIYTLDVTLPPGWQSVSQGVLDDTRWTAETPAEEIYVIAAPLKIYEQASGEVNIQAFLRTPDPALAKKYLDTTGQYMDMYSELIGPYPYSKFALVENFWETGYGMPSFTLLGSEIIRFPFILHSSYPHELLHNWWGNSVYIDFGTGNWAEGLTAYMADHLVAEGRGTGADHRRAALQRYTNYVDESTDFPLAKFISRTDPVTEAVGYGKTAMVFDMLRTEVGDKIFIKSLQTFYADNKFKKAGWRDIKFAFEKTSGTDLTPFFNQWVDGIGAPQLAIEKAAQEGDRLTVMVQQTQSGGAFTLQVPLAVYTENYVTRHTISMSTHQEIASFDIKGKAVRVEIDPEFNLFRRLHWAEIPPSLGQAFGAEDILIILPSQTSPELSLRYSKLAARWSDRDNIKIVNDGEISALPETGAVWIFGQRNKFYGAASHGLRGYDARVEDGNFRVGEQTVALKSHSSIIAVRHPKNPQAVLVGVTAHSDEAVAGLARKLPHYGKYSYLAFKGNDPTNVMKGQWPALGSPLTAILDNTVTPTAKLTPRPALATIKPLFDEGRMMGIVTELTQPYYDGRGVGTKGLDIAADYIAAELKTAGISPGGDNGSYFQNFTMEGPEGKAIKVKNIVGVIKGSNPKFDGQSVVLSAHYDHLGYGWPDVREAYKGKLHPGADDNASGTAVLLEMAYALSGSAPERSVVFLLPTGEEASLVGARHYVKIAKSYPADKIFANVNLDAVGSAGEKMMVFGTDSAREWPFIFMGIEATTGVKTTLPSQKINASDHTAFLEMGIPAIHIFGAPTMDYHKPSDTADKINPDSLIRAAIITKETIEYLGGRADPMTVQISVTDGANPPKPKTGRKASTGTMPDFSYEGEGVKIAKVTPGSAGANAGLKDGDIIKELGGTPVTNLRQYSAELKKYKPSDKVEIKIERGGELMSFALTLGAR